MNLLQDIIRQVKYHQMLHIDIIGIVKRNILKRKYSIHVRETSLYLK